MLNLQNIKVAVENKTVVNGVSLKIRPGEVHAIMGPNGSGKSSLAKSILSHPDYLLSGKVTLDKINITNLEVNVKAQKGLFLAFQHPIAVPGVSVANFLRVVNENKVVNKKSPGNRGAQLRSVATFMRELQQKAKTLGIKEEFLSRGLNEGFSGGERKKLEMLQLLALEPKYAIIDEIDTGLDVDALKLVAKGIKNAVKEYKTGVLIITHYQRILDYIKPDYVHIMVKGKIVESGDSKLAHRIEKGGYKSYE